MGSNDDYFFIEPWEDVRLRNIFLALGTLIVFMVMVYTLWSCCCREEEEDILFCRPSRIPPSHHEKKYPITPVYARELESGLVVLQSQDGEFFRILQEYDTAKNNNFLSPSSATNSMATNAHAELSVTSSNIQYVPQYTRPCYQNLPSAPNVEVAEVELIDLQAQSPIIPPPYMP